MRYATQSTLRVLKIEAEGIFTSFRYPHFMQQIQPTFEMPPPATIYGHIASALGQWFDPQSTRFAYYFTSSGAVREIEHTIVLAPAVGKLPGTAHPKVLEGNVNPFDRGLLFQPRLTLYIDRPDWLPAFQSPRYVVTLGRSQDLFTYTAVTTVELVRAELCYFEHTLLPYSSTANTARGYAVLMPRYLDYAKRRAPTFARYFVVKDRLHTERAQDFVWFGEKPPVQYWVDPTTPVENGAQRGLALLSFAGAEDESFYLA